jgi:putative Holliday junction resolvase
MARLMGIDYGEKRIGIALSDPTGSLASPLTTLVRRRGKRAPYAEIARLASEREVGAIVVGLPLDLEGNEGEWCAEVREFGEKLATRTGLPLHWIDERLSSVRAERAIRGSGLPKRRREEKERVDAAAAAVILQNFLAAREAAERRAGDAPE